jgi:hypothetical protein
MGDEMSDSSKMIRVEVAYALPEKQKVIALDVPDGTSAYDAVVSSGISGHFEGLDIDAAPMGVFSQALGSKGMPSAKEYILAEGDRVELYRPLIADPKELRKQRAEQARHKRSD